MVEIKLGCSVCVYQTHSCTSYCPGPGPSASFTGSLRPIILLKFTPLYFWDETSSSCHKHHTDSLSLSFTTQLKMFSWAEVSGTNVQVWWQLSRLDEQRYELHRYVETSQFTLHLINLQMLLSGATYKLGKAQAIYHTEATILQHQQHCSKV